MSRLVDILMEFWDWLMRVFGFRSSAPEGVPEELRRGSRLSRSLRWFWPGLLLLLVLYFGVMTWRFAFIRGDDLTYPRTVLAAAETTPPPAAAPGDAGESAAAPAVDEEQAPASCAPSQTVRMQQALIDIVVNQNDWAPAAPMYTIGVLGLIDWADTPWYDNKASFQLGVLDILRRIGVELTDTMGRVRGTSAADPDLQGAQSRLRVNERAWILNNPFDRQLNTISVAAGASYRGAIGLYERYNERLASCEALFDVRADSLRTVIDRMSKDLGSTTDQLAQRGQGLIYDPATDEFVQGPGNNRGWFDFRADNVFHRARRPDVRAARDHAGHPRRLPRRDRAPRHRGHLGPDGGAHRRGGRAEAADRVERPGRRHPHAEPPRRHVRRDVPSPVEHGGDARGPRPLGRARCARPGATSGSTC